MHNNFINNIFLYKQIVVLDIFVSGNDTQTINCCLFEYRNGTVLLIERTHLNAVLDFPVDKYFNLPIVVAINGKGIVQKQVSGNSDNSVSQFQEISSDFYRVNSVYNDFAGIAFCRNETVNSVIAPLLEKKLKVIDCTIGVYSAIGLFEIHSIANSYIGHGFTYSVGKVTEDVTPANEKVNLFGVEVVTELLFSYLIAILSFSKGKLDNDATLPPKVEECRKAFLTVKRNKPIFFTFTAILFIALIVTTFLNESVQKQQSNINYRLSQQRTSQAKEQAQKNKSDEILREAQKLAGYFAEYQFVLDRVGATMPNSLTLKTVRVNPVISKLTKNQEVIFKDGVVLIEGSSKHSHSISNWINILNTELWVKRVTIAEITKVEGEYQFVFEINLKNVR